MPDRERPSIRWIDALSLIFLAGLAVLPPVLEIHKQLVLAAIVVLQLLERRLIARLPRRGNAYSLLLKILLATLLLEHTGATGINSNYYPIYFLPVVTAATFYGPLGTLIWTSITSLAYLSLLIPALQQYRLTASGATILTIRVLFFYVAAVLVNRFVVENRRQTERFRLLSEKLENTNRQLRQAEAEARRAERLAALGQLTAGLAHEIRNPLGVIKGSAEMLGRKAQESPQLATELAGYILSEVNRLNGLVARFLDFARPSHLNLAPESIPEIVDRAVESVCAQFPEAKVKIERDYAPGVPEIRADGQLCEQIFINLITNAFQAMDGHPGTLRLSIAPESTGSEPGVLVAVEDSGPGVPPELREQIFNPFFTSKKEGVGLGLSIVAKIVDDHRGSIRLDPNSQNGARILVFLPSTPPA